MKFCWYFDRRYWLVGYFRSGVYHYVCPLPCIVLSWKRRVRK